MLTSSDWNKNVDFKLLLNYVVWARYTKKPKMMSESDVDHKKTLWSGVTEYLCCSVAQLDPMKCIVSLQCWIVPDCWLCLLFSFGIALRLWGGPMVDSCHHFRAVHRKDHVPWKIKQWDAETYPGMKENLLSCCIFSSVPKRTLCLVPCDKLIDSFIFMFLMSK